MDTATYVSLSRQSGMLKELQITANNVANMATTGFRAEGMIFAEYVKALQTDGGSVSMADARVRYTDFSQGQLSRTGGTFDFGIQGEGFFQIETAQGLRLSRAGSFVAGPQNELMTNDGDRVLDPGGAPIFIPPDARDIRVGEDGTISADGAAVAQLGVVTVPDENMMTREAKQLFVPVGEVIPVENPSVFQGFVEQSNVNPILEITRLIEVQRAYERGQKLMDKEDERIRTAIRTLGAQG